MWGSAASAQYTYKHMAKGTRYTDTGYSDNMVHEKNEKFLKENCEQDGATQDRHKGTECVSHQASMFSAGWG